MVKEFQARAMNIMAGKANLVAEVIIIVVIIIMIVSVFVEVDKEELFKLVYIPVNIIRVKHAVAKLETHTMIKCVAKMMTVIVMTTQGIMIIIVILVVVRMELPKLILLPMVSAIVVMAMAMVTIRLQYFLTEFFSQVALKKTPQAMTGRNNNSNINMNMINNICTKETISDISSGDYL